MGEPENSDDGKKLPVDVKVEVGAKAELKGEIPSSSLGRTLDALTDAIRPWTEKRGLKADHIRFQREEVLIEIARKARERAEIEGVEIQPVPNKTLVPLLERASLEENDSPLIEWWANLLTSAADPNFETRPYFSDLVSKIASDEAKLLERLWKEGRFVEDKQLPGSPQSSMAIFLRSGFEHAAEGALSKAAEFSDEEFHDQYEKFLQSEIAKFRREWEARGVVFRGVRLHVRSGKTITVSNLTESEWISLQVCKGLQLLEDFYFEYDPPALGLADRTHSVTCTLFTDLGVKFMLATHRKKSWGR